MSQKKGEIRGTAEFELTNTQLVELNEGKELSILEQYGGVEGVAKALRTDVKTGIADYIEQRKQEFGQNVYPKPPLPSFLSLFIGAAKDPLLIVLMVLGAVSVILGVAFPEREEDRAFGWIEGVAIWIAVLIVCSVTAFNDWSKERQFQKLSEESQDIPIKVIRRGNHESISVHDILVGDVVELDTGDQIPADGLFLEGFDLRADESAMTGETEMIKKNSQKPFMLSGCQIAEGCGKMLVTAVGPNSVWGQTMAKLVKEQEETPLQDKLNLLVKDIGKLGVTMAVVTVVILLVGWLIRKIVNTTADPPIEEWSAADASFVVYAIVIAVTIVVVAVPEGLPLAVTMSLAYSVKKMMKDNNLVRHLSACETMGGATNICSDKTGTLTLNQMRVVQGWFSNQFFNPNPTANDLNRSVLELIANNISINSKANLVASADKSKEFEVQGNKSEAALLLLLERDLGTPYQPIRQGFEDRKAVLRMYTFSSDRKRMSTVVRMNGGGVHVYTKGAAEIVLGLCRRFVNRDGTEEQLTPAKIQELEETIVNMAQNGLRTFCLAYRQVESENALNWDNPDEVETDLTCVAVVGIKDPLRPEVFEAVRRCRQSGIFVRMVTGDNILTAKHIAKDCHILTEDGIAMEGREFRVLPDEELDAILPKLQVLARSTPSDKFKLVKRLRELGEVVAVTGDGTNDAPALKEADVGLSMGLSGTEVAKEASDIVILDDNFDSIVKSVLWGRSVFENIRKFLQFQLTVNVVALILTMVTALTSVVLYIDMSHKREPPLTAVQLLWVNLIMDTFAALALATEPPIPELLERKPYGRFERLITSTMLRNIIAQAIYQLAILCALYYGVDALDNIHPLKILMTPYTKDPAILNDPVLYEHYRQGTLNTLVFNTFVCCQIFNMFSSRKVNNELNIFKNLFSSPLFLIIMAVITGGQALIVMFAGRFAQTYPLDWYHWLVSFGIGIVSVPIGLLVRFIPVPQMPPTKQKKAEKEDTAELLVSATAE